MILKELRNPCPGAQVTWDAGHFYSGRQPATSMFDERINLRPHSGLDLAAPEGAPILAPGAGIVVYARPGTYNEITLKIDTDDAGPVLIRSLHCLPRFPFGEGEAVDTGEVIGFVGDAGSPGAFHLHVEVILRDCPVGESGWTPWEADLHIDPEYMFLGTYGSRYEEVKFVGFILDHQKALNASGYTDDSGEPLVEDGHWGPKTSQAHVEFVATKGGRIAHHHVNRPLAKITGRAVRWQD